MYPYANLENKVILFISYERNKPRTLAHNQNNFN